MANLIGDRLGGWRRARGLTQAALAARAGLPQSAVSATESGGRDISLRTLYRLAAGLDLTPGALLDTDPPWARLTRHQVDAVSRAIVSGERTLPAAHCRLADACAAAVRPTLEACEAPGRFRARRRSARALTKAQLVYGPATLRLILGRIDKHLAGVGR